MANFLHKGESPAENDELVAQLCRGDEQAVSRLYHEYARYIAAIAYRISGNDADLDDIVQETFVAAVQGIKSLNEPDRLKVWLAKIAVRCTQRHMAKSKRHNRIESQDIPWSKQSVSTGGQSYYEIYEILHQLPYKYMVPWVLNKVTDMKLEEVGEVCGHSLATTKRRITRAEEMLKRRLDEI